MVRITALKYKGTVIRVLQRDETHSYCTVNNVEIGTYKRKTDAVRGAQRFINNIIKNYLADEAKDWTE